MFSTLISVSELKDLLPDCCVLDCRFNLSDEHYGSRMYESAHIPGALYLDLNRDLSSPVTAASGRHPLPDPQRLRSLLSASGLRPGLQAVVYDDAGGAMAARAWWLLRWLGHTAVAVLDGGFPAWDSAGYPLEPGKRPEPVDAQASTQSRTPDARVQHSAAVNTADIEAALGQSNLLLVDARARERFLGESEPIDSVAGHVPGALNRPLQENLRAGLFKPVDELRREWLQLLAGRDPATIVHMCGSGVTACHNQLAMEAAGLPGSRVYTGSWSEWIRDPARPVATGME